MGLRKYGDKQQGRVLPDDKKTAEAKPEWTEQDAKELAEEQEEDDA